MESESNRRSGSFDSQKVTQLSSDDVRKLSLSEGSIVEKESSAQSNVSPGSSEAGTLKKPRKFKPRKFIAKRFKSKKSTDEQEQNTAESGQSEQESSRKASVVSKLSEKLSPKLQRFNLVKRFSGRKSYQVSPMSNSLESGIDETKSNFEKLESLSVSETNVQDDVSKTKASDDNTSEPSTEIMSFEESENSTRRADYSSTSKEAVTLESKKVQMKITMSSKKVERSGTPSPNAIERAIDKASPPTQLSSEPSQQRENIMLPSTSAESRLSTIRDQFFNVPEPTSDIANVEQNIKPINEENADDSVTFAAVVKEGLSVKSAPSESLNEVEKYLALTSSLNTIISAAKELDDLSGVKDLKFPDLPDLKIHEGTSETEELEKSETSEVLASSTSMKREFGKEGTIFESSQIESEGMKKQEIKSKIPVDQRRLSASSDKDSTPTVHTQEARKPYHLNLSTSSSDESRSSPSRELKANEIIFEVGTPVRPLRTSPASTSIALAPLAAPETPSVDLNQQESFDESFHSPKSEKSLPLESTRRRIAYVPQLTIYTPEEQELLKSNFQANAADSFDMSSLPLDSSMFPVFDDSVENTMTSSPDKREHLYKILVIGELGTGKTSFIKRYVHQFFSQNYRATIGVDFALKVLNWDQSTIIRLQLWDIAGQERFGNMTRVYYKEAVGAFIVFDVTRSATFDAVIKWKQDLDSKVQLPDGSPIPCILLANKCDQPKQGLVTIPAKMDEYCKQNGFAGWFETSAKDNVNIEESAKALVSKILINDKLIHNDTLDGDRLVLNPEDANQKKKFCSC